ncbi:helix-turn-helix domain-containing protein [Variovorax sp. CAN2819]|uniref:helix-turn-helix domain-containing protein n=1 Tax=Variovorax sp. CAN15 TaxID=3046727 RepID=UPI002647C879|nr:helix-turn-helix domain-containing protein [Variovorax sp. CAN15]MDN6883903.1 helix-turn-helix domain-containing protein [Variovorax sp. CAN15]
MPAEWDDPDYRQAAMEATNENLIAWGVRINRECRGLTQAQLAERMGTKQSAVSKLEDSEGGDVLVSTLSKAAHALDMALLVKFVDYAEFAAQTRDVRTERLIACNYQQAKAMRTPPPAGRKDKNGDR